MCACGVYMCMFVYECMQTHITACVRRSEDNPGCHSPPSPLSQVGSLCCCLPCKSGCLTCQLSSVLLSLPASSLWNCWDYRHKLLCPALCDAANLNTGLNGCKASAPSAEPSSQASWAFYSELSLDYHFTKQNNIISVEWY